jgi:hypothetical protein
MEFGPDEVGDALPPLFCPDADAKDAPLAIREQLPHFDEEGPTFNPECLDDIIDDFPSFNPDAEPLNSKEDVARIAFDTNATRQRAVRKGQSQAVHLAKAREHKGKLRELRHARELIDIVDDDLEQIAAQTHCRLGRGRLLGHAIKRSLSGLQSKCILRTFGRWRTNQRERAAKRRHSNSKVSSKKRRGNGWQMSSAVMSTMAYESAGGTASFRALSKSFSCGKDAVQRSLAHVSNCTMAADRVKARLVRQRIIDKKEKLSFVLYQFGFDETEMDSRQPQSTGSEGVIGPVKSKVSSLVSGVWIMYGFVSGEVEQVEFTTPPLTIQNTSAKEIWSGLCDHGSFLHVHELRRFLMDRASADVAMTYTIVASDDAAANNLFFAAVDSSTTLGSDSSSKTRAVCLNHQNHLAFMNITCGILGLATFNELYLDAMFWRGGNYFRRLFAGWVAFYKSDLEESSGAETTWSRSYKVALLSYFTSTLPFRQANRKSIEASEAHESVVQLKAFLYFFDFDPAGGAKCATSWANSEERSQAVELAAHLTQQALNRTIPSLPEIGKWTKLGPTLDQHIIGFVGDLFSRCARFTLTSAYGAKLSESMQGYEQEFLKSVAFQKVGGTRFKRIMNNRGSDDFKFRVVLLALVLEPFRHLTSYLMRASHRSWSNSAEIGSI